MESWFVLPYEETALPACASQRGSQEATRRAAWWREGFAGSVAQPLGG
jgi:hypothetical protein